MSDQWWFNILEQELGPVPFVFLQSLVEEGNLGSTDVVRKGPGGEWHPASSIVGLFQQEYSENTADQSDQATTSDQQHSSKDLDSSQNNLSSTSADAAEKILEKSVFVPRSFLVTSESSEGAKPPHQDQVENEPEKRVRIDPPSEFILLKKHNRESKYFLELFNW